MELVRPEGAPEVFVIAGGGTGAACFRALARSLAARAVFERDFEPVAGEAREVLLACREVICCVDAFGSGNARNAELLDAAPAAGIPVRTGPRAGQRAGSSGSVPSDCIQAM